MTRRSEATLTADEVRALVLQEVKALVQEHGDRVPSFGTGDAIQRACAQVEQSGRGPGDVRVMESFHALFNEGVLSWGYNRLNYKMDWAHVTPLGEQVLAGIDRDPANESGFLAEIKPFVDANSVAWGYVQEAVRSYNTGSVRGAAVLLGCATEALVIEVRDALVARLNANSAKVPKALTDWKAKPVIDQIDSTLRGSATQMPHDLRERFEVHWRSLFHHVRMARNEAGHPASVRPVERAEVHGNLLLFPTLARLAHDVRAWIASSFPTS